MKKNLILSGVLGILAITSCNNSRDQKEPVNNPPPEKTAAPAPAPAAKTQDNGTTIKLNNQGVNIQSKDGSKKSNVNLSKDSTSIEISRPKK